MSLEIAIKKTVDYTKKYGCGLTLDEIKERLISSKIYSEKSLSSYKVYQVIKFKNKKTEKILKDKIKKAEELVKKYLVKFEDILMVGITGSAAAENPKKNDDIDLMIVTKRNKLWWTRLRLRYFIYKNKIPHRKYEEKENKDEFCFNLWLDEDNLLIPKNRQNLRSAMDLILMKPILNRDDIYTKFIQKNSWAKKWVATGYSKIDLRSSTLDRRKTDNLYWWIVNILVFIPQYLFMKRKMKNGEEVGLKRAFFNKVS